MAKTPKPPGAKAPGTFTDRKEFRRTFRKMRAEGQGVWTLSICTPLNIASVFVEAMTGSREAQYLMNAVQESLRQIAVVTPPLKCLLCENTFSRKKPPFAFALFHAFHDMPQHGISNGVCQECFLRYSDDELTERVITVYRDNMVSDLRVLPPLSPPGKA